MWQNSPLKIDSITTAELEEMYYQLLGEYMQSHFIFLEPLQIDMQVAKKIVNYYPNLKKRIELQQNILNISDSDLEEGTTMINSGMVNPDSDEVEPNTKDLPYTSQKSLQTRKYSKPDQYLRQYNLIIDGLYDTFIMRFKDLFITLIIGTNNLLSMNDELWNKDI